MFDEIVMVDWSASSVPTTGHDSIWIAHLEVDTGVVVLRNPSTRRRAEAMLCELLLESARRRVLVGVDVPFGYPAGFASCVAGSGADPDESVGDRAAEPPWRAVWRAISRGLSDADDNRNDRFELAGRLNALVGAGPGPFWGCPPGLAGPTLSARKIHTFPVPARGGPLEEFRITERWCRAIGRRPLSVWQTAYAGSVGGQALTAIPVLDRMLDHPVLGPRTEVWPLTTGFVPDPTCGRPDAVVFAEVWPSGFDLDLDRHQVKDAAQVVGTCEALAAFDASGELASMFTPTMSGADAALAVAEEAWILGVL